MNIVFSPSTIPAFNLAAEEYLFSKEGVDFLLLYVNEPSVIIGSNQAVLNEVDMDFCIENDIRIIRRLSGGGAVYHDRGNLNYCFISDKQPNRLPVSTDFLYPVVDILSSLQIPAEIGKRKDLWLPGGYKISGTASHVSKNRVLHHGTLLFDSELDTLQRALSPESSQRNKKATASVPSPVRNIRDFLKEASGITMETAAFIDLFTGKALELYRIHELSVLPDESIGQINALKKDKYTQRAWNYKM